MHFWFTLTHSFAVSCYFSFSACFWPSPYGVHRWHWSKPYGFIFPGANEGVFQNPYSSSFNKYFKCRNDNFKHQCYNRWVGYLFLYSGWHAFFLPVFDLSQFYHPSRLEISKTELSLLPTARPNKTEAVAHSSTFCYLHPTTPLCIMLALGIALTAFLFLRKGQSQRKPEPKDFAPVLLTSSLSYFQVSGSCDSGYQTVYFPPLGFGT